MEENGFINTLRMTEPQINDLLDTLDLNSPDQSDEESKTNRRSGADIRLPYRHPNIHLTIDHPGGGQSPFLVAGRNLTPRGLAFLHGNYLHAGTPGRVDLQQTVGGYASLRCAVLWCRHVRNHVHEAAIRFERPVDLWRHIEGAEAAADLATRIDPSELSGRILVLSEVDLIREIIVEELSATKLKVQVCATLDEAIKLARQESPEIVIFDANLDAGDVEDSIRMLRDAPIFGPLLVATGEPNTQRIQPLKDAGAAGVLRKPFQPMQLLAVLLEWMNISRSDSEESIEENEIAEKGPSFKKLVDRYIEHLKGLNEKLAGAVESDDYNAARTGCRAIFETAGIFGFMPLSRSAKKSLTQLDSCYSIEESSAQLQRTIQLSRKVCMDYAQLAKGRAA